MRPAFHTSSLQAPAQSETRVEWLEGQSHTEVGMHEDIGQMAGAIWHALNTRGELSVAQLKKEVGAKSPLFDWAIGWLAREDKIVMTQKKRSFTIRLK